MRPYLEVVYLRKWGQAWNTFLVKVAAEATSSLEVLGSPSVVSVVSMLSGGFFSRKISMIGLESCSS